MLYFVSLQPCVKQGSVAFHGCVSAESLYIRWIGALFLVAYKYPER